MWLEINSASVKIRRLNVELFINKTKRKTIVFTFQIGYIVIVLYNDIWVWVIMIYDYTKTNTNNIYNTRILLQTTGGNHEPNIVFYTRIVAENTIRN